MPSCSWLTAWLCLGVCFTGCPNGQRLLEDRSGGREMVTPTWARRSRGTQISSSARFVARNMEHYLGPSLERLFSDGCTAGLSSRPQDMTASGDQESARPPGGRLVRIGSAKSTRSTLSSCRRSAAAPHRATAISASRASHTDRLHLNQGVKPINILQQGSKDLADDPDALSKIFTRRLNWRCAQRKRTSHTEMLL